MSRRKSFVERLTNSEIVTLEQGYKHGRAVDFRERCKMLLLSARGYEVKQIEDVLSVCSHTVYSAMKSWREQGIAGLIRKKGQGRKPILQVENKEHVKAVEKAVKQHGQKSDQMLKELNAELGIEPMSKRSLLRFLKKVATDGSGSVDG